MNPKPSASPKYAAVVERSPWSRRRAQSSAKRRRDDGKRRDRADRAERARAGRTRSVAQGAKERVRTEVRREHEEALLEGRAVEAVPHRDEPRVRRQVLERQRVEQPEDEDCGESQRADGQASARGASALRRTCLGASKPRAKRAGSRRGVD